MKQLVVAIVTAILVSAGFAGVARSAEAAQTAEMKLATLAPKESAWGKVFEAWSKAVAQESNGALKLTWYYNGTQGDEAAMVGKVRSKQLDGGAFTAAGLGHVYPSAMVFNLPGLFSSWAKVDAARTATRDRLDKAFAAQGFRILGNGDLGVAHVMSRGKGIRSPADLRTMHPYFVEGDTVAQKFLELVGVTAPRALSVPQILPALSSRSSGSVDVINVPSIAAEQLQWAPQIDHVTTMPTSYGTGAILVDAKSLEGLPADARAVLERTGANTGKVLTERIRKLDQDAYERIKKSRTVIDLTPAEQKEWNELFAKLRRTLRSEGSVDGALLEAVEAAAR